MTGSSGPTRTPSSEHVVGFAVDSCYASLDLSSTGGNCLVVAQRIDEWVHVIGQDPFNVACYTLAEWIGEGAQAQTPFIECYDVRMAWELPRTLHEDCLLWHCGPGDAWIFASNRPCVGRLGCLTRGVEGVDFRHADRQVGGEGGTTNQVPGVSQVTPRRCSRNCRRRTVRFKP